ncbi:MarR family transcriptional regulator [Kiritimatiellota bacterium B12222]|nr:MarR family transcriptional regulator [Kiritimatiellota bacterium B12222]
MPKSVLSSQFIIKNALLASRLAKKVGNRLSIHGMNLSEYLLLDALDGTDQKALSRIELAELLGMSASGITRMVAPMEKLGWIEKEANPRDARQSLVKLSQVGQKLYNDAQVTFSETADALSEDLTPEQLAKMIDAYAEIH